MTWHRIAPLQLISPLTVSGVRELFVCQPLKGLNMLGQGSPVNYRKDRLGQFQSSLKLYAVTYPIVKWHCRISQLEVRRIEIPESNRIDGVGLWKSPEYWIATARHIICIYWHVSAFSKWALEVSAWAAKYTEVLSSSRWCLYSAH